MDELIITDEADEQKRVTLRARFNRLATDYPHDADAWILEAKALCRDMMKYCEEINPLRKNKREYK